MKFKNQAITLLKNQKYPSIFSCKCRSTQQHIFGTYNYPPPILSFSSSATATQCNSSHHTKRTVLKTTASYQQYYHHHGYYNGSSTNNYLFLSPVVTLPLLSFVMSSSTTLSSDDYIQPSVHCESKKTEKDTTKTIKINEQKLEKEWDSFMIQSMNPNDDDDDDDDDENDDEDDSNDENMDEPNDIHDNESNNHTKDDMKIVEENEVNDTSSHLPSDRNNNNNNNNINTEEDDEEDEPTTCTICLINRQGPCRRPWRKFEKCMKENTPPPPPSNDTNSKNETETTHDNDDSQSSSPSSSSCDEYAIPWISCVQKYRNTYLSISNNFFQKEYIDLLEMDIQEDEKIILNVDNIHSFLSLNNYQEEDAVPYNNDNIQSTRPPSDKIQDGDHVNDGNNEETGTFLDSSNTADDTSHRKTPEDIILIEGSARINLWDGSKDKIIEVAYVKDQDGKLLGYERFTEWKKRQSVLNEQNHYKTDENESNNMTDEQSDRVGQCTFHIHPISTKAVQVFALYRKDEVGDDVRDATGEEGGKSKDDIRNNFDDSETETSTSSTSSDKPKWSQTLFCSSLIPINKIISKPVENDTDDDNSNDIGPAEESED